MQTWYWNWPGWCSTENSSERPASPRLSTRTRANARSPGVTATAGCWSPRCQHTSPRKRYSSEVKRTGTSWLPSPLAARPALESLLVSAADTDVPVVASAISIAVAAPSRTRLSTRALGALGTLGLVHAVAEVRDGGDVFGVGGAVAELSAEVLYDGAQARGVVGVVGSPHLAQ